MKIAIDSSSLVLNRFSGLSEVVHNLILNLPSVFNNNQIALFLNYFRSNGSWRDLKYPGTDAYRLLLPRKIVSCWWDKGFPALDICLKGIDVFHSLHINVPPTKKIKTILTVHDCRYLAYPDLYNVREVEKYKNSMQTSLKRVSSVCTVSEFTRKEILNYFSFPDERIKVIHNGFAPIQVNEGICEKKAFEFIKKNNLPQSYLIYIGSLDPRKNLYRLLEAMAQCMRGKYDFPEMLLVGVHSKQWIKSNCAIRARKLGLFDRIHPCGMIEKDLLIGLTLKACALCYPSLYEGFGFPPLEAMSLGVPVLAGKASSVPEIVGDSACLINPKSADEIAEGLNKIVFDSDYRQLLIESGYRQITKFSWKKAAAEYVNLYKEVFTS